MSNGIFIICTSGTREKLQMAAMIAAVGAASGSPVSVFFSMNALQYFIKGGSTAAPVEGEFGSLMANNEGVPRFKDLFHQAAELGDAALLPCSMAMDLMEVSESDLDAEFGTPTGLTRFLSDAEGGQLYTF